MPNNLKDKLIIRPSAGVKISKYSKDDHIDVFFFYNEGSRRLKIRFLNKYISHLEDIIKHGIIRGYNNADSKYPKEIQLLIDELINRNIIVDNKRELWININKYNRFDRQMRLLSEKLPLDKSPHEAQNNIFDTKILIVGIGGMGSNILQQLVMMGFRNFHIIDPDTIELSNLNRQTIYSISDIGKLKIDVASEWAASYYDKMQISKSALTLEKAINKKCLNSYEPDLIINCADSPSIQNTTREIITNMNKAIPVLVGGGYFLFKVFVGPLIMPGFSACLDCNNYSNLEENTHLTGVGGNISSCAAIGAGISSLNVFKLFSSASECDLLNNQYIIDLNGVSLSKKKLIIDTNCKTCGKFKRG